MNGEKFIDGFTAGNPMSIDHSTGEPVADSSGSADRGNAREAMDRLNESNRVLVEARMLPKDKKLTGDQVRDVIANYRAYIKERGITATQAAKECQYSTAVLSAWASENYDGNVDAVTHRVNEWMERDRRRQQVRRQTDYVRTWVAEDIRTTVHRADKQLMMAAIVVPAGAGKTKVLEVLTDELRGVYVYCETGMTVRELYLAMARVLGWRVAGGTRTELLDFVVKSLTGTRRIVFLDEAHQLGHKIGSVRAIYDRASVPIVMAGTEEIISFIDDRAHGGGQFSSRCIHYNVMDYIFDAEGPNGDNDVRDLFTVDEIKEFFDRKRIRFDRDALRLVWSLACLPRQGTLRFVDRIINAALDISPDVEVVSRELVLMGLEAQVGKGRANRLREIVGKPAQISTRTAVAKSA